MNTFELMDNLLKVLEEDRKSPNNNAEYNKALDNAISSLTLLTKYY